LRSPVRFALLLAALAASGCASLADRIAHPEGEALLAAGTLLELERGIGLVPGSMPTPGGPRIAWIEIPAAKRGYAYKLSREGDQARFGFTTSQPAEPIPVRGSIVYLHGAGLEGSSLLPWALAFAEHGYRGYAIDLRNHGRSGRAPAGYGTREAGDVAAVVRSLRAAGELPEPVFLFGVSLGASTALFAEPQLRDMLAGIVALEPFANADVAIRGVIGAMLAERPHGVLPRLEQAYLRWRYSRTDLDAAIADAGERLGLDLREVDLSPVVAGSNTCTLLLHGAEDSWLDPEASRRLAMQSPEVHFHAVLGMGHLGLPLRIDWLADPISGWLAATAAGAGCPDITIPPDPVAAPVG
jgi:pimeloyl-ACP methyl ester carboxylesterase